MLDENVLEFGLDHCLTETHFPPTLGKRYQGKVRDTYARPDGRLILVTTDRISAFDHILPHPIPFKGQILNQLAAYFFEATEDIMPNHVLAVPDPNATVATQCKIFPIEFVVRGYLAGHAWRTYASGTRILCGKKLPEGLKQNSKLPTPILTPTTKAASGHDLDISREEIIAQGLMDAETFDYLEQKALELFARGTAMALQRGLLLVDTKYEFGEAPNGTLILADEVHTPDSSRYFYADTYEERLAQDLPQRQLSKEFVREWLMARGFRGRTGDIMPDLPREFRKEVTQRYVELYETLTGQTFTPDTHPEPEKRIYQALKRYFAQSNSPTTTRSTTPKTAPSS